MRRRHCHCVCASSLLLVNEKERQAHAIGPRYRYAIGNGNALSYSIAIAYAIAYAIAIRTHGIGICTLHTMDGRGAPVTDARPPTHGHGVTDLCHAHAHHIVTSSRVDVPTYGALRVSSPPDPDVWTCPPVGLGAA